MELIPLGDSTEDPQNDTQSGHAPDEDDGGFGEMNSEDDTRQRRRDEVQTREQQNRSQREEQVDRPPRVSIQQNEEAEER